MVERVRESMDEAEAIRLDPRAVRRSFEAASATYDEAAVLQREVCARQLERLELVKLAPRVILDLGCGTGQASRALRARYPGALVIAADLAPGMLGGLRGPAWRRFLGQRALAPLGADARRLPLSASSVDLVFSSLMLQWCDVPDEVFVEVQRVLRAGGLFTFTTLGPDTLRELRGAWATIDAAPHVHHFHDMHDIGDALVRSRLGEPVLDVEQFTLTYRDARTLMRELKLIGARNASRGRRPGLTGRHTLSRVESAYERHRRDDGTLPATYEVIYGQAWGSPATPAQHRLGEVRIPADRIPHRIPSGPID